MQILPEMCAASPVLDRETKGWCVKSWESLAGQRPIVSAGRKGGNHGTGRPAPEAGKGEHTRG